LTLRFFRTLLHDFSLGQSIFLWSGGCCRPSLEVAGESPGHSNLQDTLISTTTHHHHTTPPHTTPHHHHPTTPHTTALSLKPRQSPHQSAHVFHAAAPLTQPIKQHIYYPIKQHINSPSLIVATRVQHFIRVNIVRFLLVILEAGQAAFQLLSILGLLLDWGFY
jgi:hypothetical protein